jgi:hypothetical protein
MSSGQNGEKYEATKDHQGTEAGNKILKETRNNNWL